MKWVGIGVAAASIARMQLVSFFAGKDNNPHWKGSTGLVSVDLLPETSQPQLLSSALGSFATRDSCSAGPSSLLFQSKSPSQPNLPLRHYSRDYCGL